MKQTFTFWIALIFAFGMPTAWWQTQIEEFDVFIYTEDFDGAGASYTFEGINEEQGEDINQYVSGAWTYWWAATIGELQAGLKLANEKSKELWHTDTSKYATLDFEEYSHAVDLLFPTNPTNFVYHDRFLYVSLSYWGRCSF